MAMGGVANSKNSNGTALEWLADPGQIGRKLFGKKPPAATPVGDAYAALTREQWNTYVNNFVPIENKLIEYATDPAVVTNAMATASADVNAAFDAQQGAAGRRLRGLGMTLDADEQKASDRSYGLARSLADVGAQNTTRDTVRQRQQSVLGNPAPEAITI